MEKKDLKKLNRAQLLELLIALAKENKALKEQLEKADARLQDKEIRTKEAGSIAQASLQLNSVFEAAQNAADQYIENLKRMETEQSEICERMKAAEKQLEEEIAKQSAAIPDKFPMVEEEGKNEPKKKRGLFGALRKGKAGGKNE